MLHVFYLEQNQWCKPQLLFFSASELLKKWKFISVVQKTVSFECNKSIFKLNRSLGCMWLPNYLDIQESRLFGFSKKKIVITRLKQSIIQKYIHLFWRIGVTEVVLSCNK